VGLMKSFYTAIHSGGYARGRGGVEAKSKTRRRAKEAEEWIQEKIRMSFCTEAEFRQWLIRNTRRRWSACTACPLKRHRKNVAYGEGVMEPLLMIVGEAPRVADDDTGRVFMDRDGDLLRKVCAKLDLDLARHAFLTNTIGCLTPKGRKPEKHERRSCSPRLVDQVKTLQPYVLLLLGDTALRWLETEDRAPSVEDYRGLISKDQWPDVGYSGKLNLKAIFCTWHPDTILKAKTKAKKKLLLTQFADDLKKVKRVVDLLDSKIERSFVDPDEEDYDEDD